MAKKNSGKIARRYANSLLRAIEKKHGKEGKPTPAQKIADVFNSFLKVFESDRELLRALQNPMFSREDRLKAIKKLAELEHLPEIATNFIEVCFVRDRISEFSEILRTFAQLADEAAGVLAVEIITASEVGKEEAASVEQMLQQKIAGNPKFNWKLDGKILGGMIIRYEDKIIDGSVLGKMKQIEQRLENINI